MVEIVFDSATEAKRIPAGMGTLFQLVLVFFVHLIFVEELHCFQQQFLYPLIYIIAQKFANVDNEIRSMYLKEALTLLSKAGIAHLCFHSASFEQPLGGSQDEKKFKVYFFDIGLAQRMLGLVLENWQIKSLQVQTLGGIAEQFVAQELIAYTSTKTKAKLYYWHRETKNSNAEVDFVVVKNQQIVPIEVKAGATGHLRSMHLFLANHPNSKYGLKISENLFSKHNNITEIPLYGIEAWLKQNTSS